MIAQGTYYAKAVSADVGETSKGTPQIGVQLEIISEGPAFGSTITWYGFFTEGTQERTIQSLRHMGYRGEDIGELSGPMDELMPSNVEIVIEHETYQGKTSAKVRWINKMGGSGPALKNAMDPAAKKKLGGDLKGLFRKMPAPKLPEDQPSAATGKRF